MTRSLSPMVVTIRRVGLRGRLGLRRLADGAFREAAFLVVPLYGALWLGSVLAIVRALASVPTPFLSPPLLILLFLATGVVVDGARRLASRAVGEVAALEEALVALDAAPAEVGALSLAPDGAPGSVTLAGEATGMLAVAPTPPPAAAPRRGSRPPRRAGRTR